MIPIVFALRGVGRRHRRATRRQAQGRRRARTDLGDRRVRRLPHPAGAEPLAPGTGGYTGRVLRLRRRLRRAPGRHVARLRAGKLRRAPDLNHDIDHRRRPPTHCPYCALQCAMTLTRDGCRGGRARPPVVVAGRDFPTNRGGLCKKGWTSAELLRSPSRLLAPLVRGADGELHESGWDDALDLVADRLREHPCRRTAPTPSPSSAAAASRTRRPTSSASSPGSRSARAASTTTAGSACRRPRPPATGRSASTAGCRSRSRTSTGHPPCSCSAANAGRDDAAVHRAPRRRAGGRRAHRGRPAPHRHGAAHRRGQGHPRAARPGHRPRAAARAHPRRDRRGPRRRRVPRRAHDGIRPPAAERRRLVARARAVGHRACRR